MRLACPGAIRFAVFLPLLLPALLAAAGSDGVLVLDPLEVSGSHLELATDSRLLPIVRYSQEQIDLAAAPSTGDLLRDLPFNAGGMLSNSSVVGLNGAHQGINLRGLGNGATLVLVNGRRLPSFPHADPFVFSADVGSLPTSAVESIEVLKDGASAIYGSDAIAGVISIKLKRAYSGGSLRTGFQTMEGTDWNRRTAALTLGRSDAESSLMLAVEIAANDDVRFSERRVSRTEDLRWLGGQDLRSDWTMPGQVQVPADAANVPDTWHNQWISIGTIQDGVVRRGGADANPELTDFVLLPEPVVAGIITPGDSRRFYDENPDSSMIPEESSRGITGTWVRTLNASQEFSVDWGFTRRVTTMTLPPPRVVPGLDSRAGDGPDGQVIVPAANPYNPFGVDLYQYAFLLTELGLRERRFTNHVSRLAATWTNRISNTWQLEVFGQWSQNRLREDAINQILTTDVQAGLAGRAGGWINPFGPSDPGVVASLRTAYRLDQSMELAGSGAIARGSLWADNSHAVSGALGLEVRREDYRQAPRDEAIAIGAHASWDPFPKLDLDRSISSVFAESVATWESAFELQLAARSEHYSDFGGAIKPKLAFAWRPRPGLGVRYGRSYAYRAPDLLQLLPQPKTGTGVLRDPRRPDLGMTPVTVMTAGNPDLRPETSATDSIGVELQAHGTSSWSLSLDAWRIRHGNKISYAGAETILRRELDPDFPSAGLIERFSAEPDGRPGALYAIHDRLINIREVTVEGADAEASWRGRGLGGHVDARLLITHLFRYRQVHPDGTHDSLAGSISFPRWRANALVHWEKPPWRVGWSADFFGRHDGAGTNYFGGSVDQHARTFHNLTVRRKIGDDLSVTARITNVFDTDPPVFFADKRGYLAGVYHNRARGYGISVERTW